MKAFAFKVFTWCMLTAAAFSCQKEEAGIEDQLIGKWTLTDKTVAGVPVILTDCEKLSAIEFRNNSCLLLDGCAGDTANSGWNYKYGMLNLSVHLPAAYYIDQLDETVLQLSRKDISQEGQLQVTLLSYRKGQNQ
jgi:hypothetical protein